jgi:cell division protein ZapD
LILYEFPFNESLRTMLRLEHLFDRLGQLIVRTDSLDHHFALATIFEIMDVASRADLKSDLLKELERYRSQFQALRGNPAIEEALLQQVLGRIDHAYGRLNELQGKAGQALAANEWLMSVRSRINIPGGTCEFDLPAYFAWQKGPAERRQRDLHQWVTTLMPLAEALKVLMGLLRDSGHSQMVVAAGGQFQQSLSSTRSYQLLRLRIDEQLGLVPEISGHRLMVSVRLMREDEEGRLKPAQEDASFELALCA